VAGNRKELDVKIEEEGRDKGKVFHLVEMGALDAEDWAMRAAVTLTKFGFQVPDRFAGMAGIAAVGYAPIAASVGVPEIRELMNEMLSCINIPIADPNNRGRIIEYRPMIREDVEEITTILKLRLEVFQLHTGFSIAELYQRWTSAKTNQVDSSGTQDSPLP
jgi:hypothetical protein